MPTVSTTLEEDYGGPGLIREFHFEVDYTVRSYGYTGYIRSPDNAVPEWEVDEVRVNDAPAKWDDLPTAIQERLNEQIEEAILDDR